MSCDKKDIFGLALIDPASAALACRCGADIQSYGGRVELTSASLNQAVPVTFQQIPFPGYIVEATYDMEMPGYAPGNILAPISLDALAKRPGVDLKIQVNQGWGPANYVMNSEFEPVQHLILNAQHPARNCCDWLKGKYVWQWQSFAMLAILRRALQEGEDPMILSFSLKIQTVGPQGMMFLQNMRSMDEAIDALEGYITPHEMAEVRKRFSQKGR